jgi:uroporphyrin-III C-methyltransferase/precorrin-2 dehydrogenase/sirohydrochlorin ferrochelatase/uroporphyrin-III C-methyltransferase
VKAHRLISTAVLVVHDRLVSPAILALISPAAERICVGKESGRHSVPQAEINALLVQLARAGHHVVRLKGGDPFIFGRGGEEALHLVAAGIPCEIVPGITAAAGVCAAAGIPLTHRGLATSVRLITGHAHDDEPLDIDWRALADPACTLVFYMGLGAVRMISDNLIAAGLPPDTPAAAIENGTTARQRRALTTLAGLPDAVAAAGLKPPTLLVVGRVVVLAGALMPSSIEEWREAAE